MVMKTYCKQLAIDEAFVQAAYDEWRRHEAGRKNEWRVIEEHGSPQALVAEIVRDANALALRFDPIKTEPRREGGKVRDIGIEPVKQQVCGYVADAALSGLMSAKMGFWQVSRPGMGQFKGGRAAQRWLRSCAYHVHADVRKCYDSASTAVVMRVLRRYVRSDVVLHVCEAILASYPEGHLMIGSYFSMRMAHLVLSFGYHFVESLGKARRGKRYALVKHQLWYADDIWLFGDDKRDLKRALRELERYMKREFGLSLKPWKVCRAGDDEPADVAGPVARPGKISVRSSTFLKARRAVFRFRRKPRNLELARRLVSYNGWFEHTDCYRFCVDNRAQRAAARAKRDICQRKEGGRMSDLQDLMSNDEPARVEVIQHGNLAHVYLRRDVRKDARDNGPEGEPTEFWAAKQLHYCEAGAPDPADIEVDFDGIWAAKVAAMRTDGERIADVEQGVAENGASIEDAYQAIAELAECIVGGE